MNIAYIAFAVLFLYLFLFTFFPDTPRHLYKILRKEVFLYTFESILFLFKICKRQNGL